MAKNVLFSTAATLHRTIWRRSHIVYHDAIRLSSSYSAPTYHGSTTTPPEDIVPTKSRVTVPLNRISTAVVLRNLLLSSFFTRPLFFKTGMAFLKLVADSDSTFLNPDKNPVLRATIKPLIYDQFCAGRNEVEVQKTSQGIRDLGFSGSVLVYGIEMYVEHAAKATREQSMHQLKMWKEGNLQTLRMGKDGDWLGLKMTGAGPAALNAMLNNQSPPPEFLDAMNELCELAQEKGSRIWVDAEQQAVQASIDKWTIDLMRRWNRGSKPVVYNTIQAYLKGSRAKLQHQLTLAKEEGWQLAVKLVRGAYMAVDERSRIHDTKADTDKCYDSIVKDLLGGTLPGFTPATFPDMALLCAGHNSNTIRKAIALAQDLSERGALQTRPEFAQLMGMADEIGCEIAQIGEQKRAERSSGRDVYVPRVYKCLTWGSLKECMQYLVRRAVENQGATERIEESRAGFAAELRRRIWRMPA